MDMIMKKYLYLPAVLVACFSLTACIDELTGDSDNDSVSQADIDYAKSFIRDFNTLDASMIDMEQPMITASQQFISDTENIDEDAMAASMVALASMTALAVSIIKDVALYEGDEVIALDYSKFNASYNIDTLISEKCASSCDAGFDLSSTGVITYDNNQLTINAALVTVDGYQVTESYLGNGEWLEERGSLIGQFDSTVSITITLPDEDLNNNNELSIAISNVSVTSSDTAFSLSLDRLGLDTQIDIGGNISLNDLLNIDAEDDTELNNVSLAYQLNNVELILDEARFNGNFNMDMSVEDDQNGLGGMLVAFSIDGTLTNSLGDSVLAKYAVNVDSENSDSGLDANLGAEIEFTFQSQNSQDLTLAFKFDVGAKTLTNNVEEATNFELNMLTEFKIIAGEKGFIVSYGIDIVAENVDTEPSGSGGLYIKIQDATRTDKDFYIILNMNAVASTGSDPEIEFTSGVYVNNTLVGEWEFDQYENTQAITFDDEVIILGDVSFGAGE